MYHTHDFLLTMQSFYHVCVFVLTVGKLRGMDTSPCISFGWDTDHRSASTEVCTAVCVLHLLDAPTEAPI
jgi:hypothetical protein